MCNSGQRGGGALAQPESSRGSAPRDMDFSLLLSNQNVFCTFSQSALPRLWLEGRLEGKVKALQAAHIINSEAYDPWQRETKASNQLIMGKQRLFPGCGWGQCNHSLENGRGSQQNQRARPPLQERQEKPGLTARIQKGATGRAMWPLAAGKSWGQASLALPGRNEASSM